ncbi:phytanoyl-CoA dioxygenase family protein [Chryseobacterium formosus]|uniref:Phytanoyl-CoA dioxygenase family protein n=1 Tax=Chryseobacterium formosus TaxID=1537363 RepID=A0ABT3XRQ2_9FLAO|nr:phytanoyl-CoA dioxygenase family protein [Chryseobacterium formosus]MCX8523605.1 phytanoyl-CoA dioxygenase family protein [Chryseobacterium formosus]
MLNLQQHKNTIADNGFSVISNVFSEEEIEKIAKVIQSIDTSKDTFRKSEDLFAIRQFLKEIPEVKDLIFNENLKTIIEEIFGENYFAVKSIYFDKPEKSNWYVAYHQDLTISVDKKIQLENFGPWTTKQNQFAVQPPLDILENIFTIRIHLDDTDENNGALKVVPKSHSKGIYRPETINWDVETENICNVEKGGIMIMKPLILHGSNRTTNGKKRRVIHIEFSDRELPEELNWSERIFQHEANS